MRPRQISLQRRVPGPGILRTPAINMQDAMYSFAGRLVYRLRPGVEAESTNPSDSVLQLDGILEVASVWGYCSWKKSACAVKCGILILHQCTSPRRSHHILFAKRHSFLRLSASYCFQNVVHTSLGLATVTGTLYQCQPARCTKASSSTAMESLQSLHELLQEQLASGCRYYFMLPWMLAQSDTGH